MDQLTVMITIVAVAAAAVAAVYKSMAAAQERRHHNIMPEAVPPQQYRIERRPNNPVINENRPRCTICTDVMTNETMRFMNCGHAFHDVHCFEDYRQSRRDCPYCGRLVLRLDLQGDYSAICNQPMEEETMKYLKCEHAFHSICLITVNWNANQNCSVCS
ncbi:vacuolar protein sorting-associated protein 11 homolog isoform X2 [Drosophila sulfurigaster albostrigata]|uniref:vacuolar protein sorting-associated protein 11 homolog isoform X2 n=1 Tax=Drosophila sulfurigaster albostrigata TaxID=89887 RepID=UPI002D21B4A7|nr:vacuolar protein sorting-associated protein 11 homolog isoform X2 [Drosophila sulfurigaster albostrigata]